MTQSPKPNSFNFGNLDGYVRDSGSPEPAGDPQATASRDDHISERPQVGAPFIPFKKFLILAIPEAMARIRELPPGAKLVYGRLCRYAGEDGLCYPAVELLAAEVGLGKRQTQKHLKTLQRMGFIFRKARFRNHKQTSNSFVFLWHQIFEDWENEHPKKGANWSSPRLSSEPASH